MYDPLIKTFIAVAEGGSFSKVAEGLFISPTAVMKQINALEKELGVTLFTRTNHGLTLTSAGESVLQDGRYIVEYCERAVQKAREIEEGESRKSKKRTERPVFPIFGGSLFQANIAFTHSVQRSLASSKEEEVK